MSTWHQDRRSKHERGYGYRWKKTRELILKRDSYLCIPCKKDGRATPAKQVDHIRPKYLGGTDDWANLQSICEDCHKKKTAQEAADARKTDEKVTLCFDSEGRPIWPDDR